MEVYDVVIIGGGPAGLSAGLYASRAKLKTLLIEKDRTGGQVNTTEDLENYPGIMDGMKASQLMERMTEQAQKFGTIFVKDKVTGIIPKGNIKVVKGEKEDYGGKTVIIATGATPRMLGVKGEKEFVGKGVSYCATCDADFFVDLDVAVVGGGDSAIEEALYLTKFAKRVYVIHRRDRLRATGSLQERAKRNNKIHFIWNTTVSEIKGDGIVEKIALKNKNTGEEKELKVDGVFIFVGTRPISDFVRDVIKTDDEGYIITDEFMMTSMEGVFAAGDVRKKFLRQVITAAAEGAIAATAAEKYINGELKIKEREVS